MADKILEESRRNHLVTIGFIKALKNSLRREKAFKIVAEAFSFYMISYYDLLLSATLPNSQQRFDKFRRHYEKYAQKSKYVKVIESNPLLLRVRYARCPFYELLKENRLAYFAYAFCLSDYSFTKAVLPGVQFIRSHEIVKGDNFCDHTWVRSLGKKTKK